MHGEPGQGILDAVAGGKRRAETHSHARPRLGPLSRLGANVLGIVLGGLAWWYLVRAAVDFGHLALAGESRAWVFTLAAAAGAAVCLLLVIVLIARVLMTLGLVSEYEPRRAAPRRRAEPSNRKAADPATGDAAETATDTATGPAATEATEPAPSETEPAKTDGHRAAPAGRRAAPPHRHGGGGGHRAAPALRRADRPEADGSSR